VEFADEICGSFTEHLAQTAGDFLILRRDKLPAYQLAVVVDDAEQGVTEVVRGDDLLASTPRQIALGRALGYRQPSYFHVPLVLDAEGKRLAKREHSLSLARLRELGADPRSVVVWALASCGFAVDERVTAADGCNIFSMERLKREPVIVTENSLTSLVLRRSTD
jgi:glutamyl-tRNA synthetase